MKTLQNFKALIIDQLSLLNITKDQFEIFAENGAIKPGSNKQNEQGLHYLDFNYRLALHIENMKSESMALLSLLTLQFFNGLTNQQETDGIGFDFEANDLDKTIDIEITFAVIDPVYLVPVAGGETSPIVMDGKMWGFGTDSLNIAESLAAINANA